MKSRTVTFKETGDTAATKAAAMTRALRGSHWGQIPSDAGDAFDVAYIVTDAPLPVIRKLAKSHGLTVRPRGGPRTVSARRNPSVTVMRANPATRATPLDASALPSVRRGVKTPTVYVIVGAREGLENRQMAFTKPEAVRAISKLEDGSYIYLSRLGLRQPGVWIKSGGALVHRAMEGENPSTAHVATVRGRIGQRRAAMPTTRRNPPATRVAFVLSKRVIDLSYLHAEDKRRPYRHKFAAGVTCQLLTDGSVRLVRADGKPCWKNFPK